MITKILSVILSFISLSIIYYGCEINPPAVPVWDINLNLPFTNKSYNIFDIIKRHNNLGADSSNNGLVFLYGESNYKRSFGNDIKFDGLKISNVAASSTFELDTFIVIDDSTYIRKMEFLDGILNFTFFNNTQEEYGVNAVLKNLFSMSLNDTARINLSIPPSSERSVNFNLAEYYIKNNFPENRLYISLLFESSAVVPVNFNYSLTPYSIRKIEGRLKPLNTGITNDEVTDPFGSDVPEGSLNFASITADKNFLIAKKFSPIYRVDFTDISIIGENKNGHRVRLKYLKNGNAGDPVDSVFSLTLPSERDTIAFPINESNSNILEFINNIPKRMFIQRNDFLNLSYQEGMVDYTDSLTLKLAIQVPLDVSITEPIVFSDTVDVGIDDEDQRKNLDKAKNLIFTLNADNGFPLRISGKVLILDSSFVPMIAISKIAGNLPDSSVNISAAQVGADGFVSIRNTTTFFAALDSTKIQQIKRMGKIIYEYKLYTDPAMIPPPLTTVKLKGTDLISASCFGTLKYRIDF